MERELQQNTEKVLIGREFPKEVTPLINQARKSIDIMVYNWLWYPTEVGSTIQKFNQAIVGANRNGVEVRALVRNTQIMEILKGEGIKVKRLKSSKTLHTKLMIIDREVAILGSHNYSMNAFNINYEVSIITRHEKSVNKLINYYSVFFE